MRAAGFAVMRMTDDHCVQAGLVPRAALLWGLLFLAQAVAATDRPRAEVFAPGVISLPGRVEFCLAMAPNEKEVFFTVRKAPGQWQIHRAQFREKAWQASTVAPFSGTFSDSEPSLSPDGQRLFFSSNRPGADGTAAAGFDLWVVERLGDGWSAPRPLPAPVNGPGDQWRASLLSQADPTTGLGTRLE